MNIGFLPMSCQPNGFCFEWTSFAAIAMLFQRIQNQQSFKAERSGHVSGTYYSILINWNCSHVLGRLHSTVLCVTWDFLVPVRTVALVCVAHSCFQGEVNTTTCTKTMWDRPKNKLPFFIYTDTQGPHIIRKELPASTNERTKNRYYERFCSAIQVGGHRIYRILCVSLY